MKKITKAFIFILTLFLFIINININLKADTKTFYNDTKSANYTTNLVEDKEIYPGTRFVHDNGYTMRGTEKVIQDARILFQKSDKTKGSKTVTWAVYDEKHSVSGAFFRHTLKDIALDYEKHHPGWKVVGGVNADQYYWKYGTKLAVDGSDLFENQPYFALKADNENWFTIDAYGRYGCNITGFKNDGSNDPLVFNNTADAIKGFVLSVLDNDGNVLEKFNIDELNPKTKKASNYTYVYALYDSGNKTVPISRDKESKSVEISSNNNLFIIKDAEKAFLSNSKEYSFYKQGFAVDAFFGKGIINEINTKATLKATDFAIETTNPNLLKLLKKDVKVICQYELGGGYELCEAGTGWHNLQKYNGVDKECSNDSYNTKAYPRSCFGVTYNGEVVLLNGNGTTRSGWTANELNALAKAYNIKTLFQMDGGGSASMIVRNEKGELVTANKPSDGNDRSILSGIFFVIKDSEYEGTVKNLQADKVDLEINVKDYGTDKKVVKNFITLKGLIDGKDTTITKEVIDNKVTFDKLSPNFNYSYNLEFLCTGEITNRKTLTSYYFTTAKEVPTLSKIKLEKVGDDLKIRLYLKDPNEAVKGFMNISFDGGKTYNFFSGKEVVLKNFDQDPFSNIVIKFSYDTNDGSGKHELLLKDNLEITFNLTVIYSSMLESNNQFIDNIFK